MKLSSVKLNAFILLVALITSIAATSASSCALPKKESKSFDKFVDGSSFVLEIEETASVLDDAPSAEVYPDFQPVHNISNKPLAPFALHVSVFQPQLITTFTNAP